MTPEETKAALAELDYKIGRLGSEAPRIIRQAANAGVKLLSARMKAVTPISKVARLSGGKTILPGGMRRSVGWSGLKLKKLTAGAKAGLAVGKKTKGQDVAHHGHLFIMGTDLRYTGFSRVRKRGKTVDLKRNKNKILFRGRMPKGAGFIKSATQSAEGDVWKLVIGTVKEGSDKVWNSK